MEYINNKRFSNSGFIIRDLSRVYHCRIMTDDFSITKPTIIDFGGNGTITRKAANGRCTRTERLMGLKAKEEGLSATYEDFDMISFYYGKNSEGDVCGSLTREEASEFVDRLFMPLCINSDGTPKTMTECCKNFSKLIFRSHCYGNEALGSMLCDLQLKLISKGFSLNKINRIYSHAFHLSYSPFNNDIYLPNVKVNSMRDSFITERKYGFGGNSYPFMQDVNGVDIRSQVKRYYGHLTKDTALDNQKEILITSSKLLNSDDFVGLDIDEHSGGLIDLDEYWNASESAKNSKNCECVSRLSGYALSYAGARAYDIYNDDVRPYPLDLNRLENELNNILNSYSQEELRVK